ncbi:MAG: PAS domain S-box protein [Desulfobacterales bacterium]|nr:PAS domain S-box protein [Desulfobacterales bacterium]
MSEQGKKKYFKPFTLLKKAGMIFPPNNRINKSAISRMAKTFLIIFIPLAILTGGILGFLYENEKTDRVRSVKQKEINQLNTVEEVLSNYLNAIALDVLVVSKHDELRKYFATNAKEHLSSLGNEFLGFSKIKGIYDQVRLLDENGMELLRVNYHNGKPLIVPQEQLQFKGNRYYFNESLQLSENEIFASPFDLNMEHSQIELPIKPVIRFGTPIFDEKGKKRGVLLLNYLGADLLKILDRITTEGQGKSILLNSQGYYLRGLNSVDEWGFMYDDKKDQTFAKHYPDSWQKIRNTISGQIMNEKGLFTHLTIEPLSEVQVSNSVFGKSHEPGMLQRTGPNYHWKLISYIDSGAVAMHSSLIFKRMLTIYAIVIIFLAIGSAFISYARERRRQADKEINSHREYLKSLVEQRTSELTHVNAMLKKDIMERQRAEEALLDSESYMRSIFRAAPIGIGVVRDRVFKQVNDQFCDMLGYSKDELINQSSIMTYPSEDEYHKVGRVKYDQIRRLGTGAVETCFKKKNGDIIDVLLCSTPINSNDFSAGVTFTALDITNQKQAAAALRENEEKYRTITETMEDSIFICSSDFKIEFMNRTMIEEIGRDATGELCYEALHNYTEKCPWCVMDRVLKGETISSEINIPDNGKTYHVTNTPISHQDGRISKLAVFRDVTEIKNMELHLRQTQKMEAIGTLAGGIAHDFNNILSGILGFSQLAKGNIDYSEKASRNIDQVIKGAQRAAELVQQILTFSRQTEYKMRSFPIIYEVKEALKLLRASIPSNIDIKTSLQSKSMIHADPIRIHQIVMNLCTNSYQAMKEAGGTLTVSLSDVDIAKETSLQGTENITGKYLLLEVKDTGIGMDKNTLEKAFEPYFTTKGVGEGTGIGLALVHAIIEEHNGILDVSSEPGVGTHFKIYFPIVERRGRTKVEFDHWTSDHKGNETIMVVDDEEQIRKVYADFLKAYGYRVKLHSNGLSALEAFKKDPSGYDIIISDLTMPGMTGDKLAGEILKINSKFPIILCTGFSNQFNGNDVDKMGIKSYLKKPISGHTIVKEVRMLLDKSAGHNTSS